MNFDIENLPIKGVEIKLLTSHGDERGFFREIIRNTDSFFKASNDDSGSPFGQWSHSKMIEHTVKAWHYHHRQTDWWYITSGLARVGLIDNRKESPTYLQKMDFLFGEDHPDAIVAVVKIPPGVLHGCRVLSSFAHLFYITSHTYDPKDEGRIPYDASEIDFEWGDTSQAVVVENDTRYFSPQHPLDYSA
jgi:dTDP-4-dehydrorhamnose 3,5-epimerase